MRKERWYVGESRAREEGRRIFRSAGTPRLSRHGYAYFFIIGPFRTKRGAQYAARSSGWVTVAEAERRAAAEARDAETWRAVGRVVARW